jgi:hypothetical protein
VRARTFIPLIALSALAMGSTWSCSQTSVQSGSQCARARIGGKDVCLKPNVRCERSHERVYRSYGLTCVLEGNGYRLQQRTYIAPPNP